eukprot:scaffold1552_cov165-Pinguiococcus_pyrenoidosus.AAC.6
MRPSRAPSSRRVGGVQRGNSAVADWTSISRHNAKRALNSTRHHISSDTANNRQSKHLPSAKVRLDRTRG